VAALDPGTKFPSIALRDAAGAPAAVPRGESIVAVFKTTCPTCELTWPYLEKLRGIGDGRGLPILALSQDDPVKSRDYAARLKTRLDTAYDPDPYPASDALGVTNVPTLFRIGADGLVAETIVGFDRERMRSLARRSAAIAGVAEVELFPKGDPAPPFKPG
jgi:peroxiredoxin